VFAPEIVPDAKPPMPFVSSHSRQLERAKSVQISESKFIIEFFEIAEHVATLQSVAQAVSFAKLN
jgi:hypothetical protein